MSALFSPPGFLAANVNLVEVFANTDPVGQVITGQVKKIMEFGAFVEIVPNRDGLVHISQLADYRVKKVEDVVKEGDLFDVKLIDVDSQGRVNLSRKATLPKPEGYVEEAQPPRRPDSNRGHSPFRRRS